MNNRRLNTLDFILDSAENALRTLQAKPIAHRTSPATEVNQPARPLSTKERQLSASLMRVNHTGEVCAQALYKGQALTAKLDTVRKEMEHAAAEEEDHLAWCQERLGQLGSQPSILNPAFYLASYGMGAVAGLISDKVSLGFVAATEDQVCEHLRDHQQRLPETDAKSRSIVKQMLIDEKEHGHAAIAAGGLSFPPPIKKAMSLMSKVMTSTVSKI